MSPAPYQFKKPCWVSQSYLCGRVTLRQCAVALLLIDALTAVFSLVGFVESCVQFRSALLLVLQIVRVVLFLPTAFYAVKVFFYLKEEHSAALLILRALLLIATLALQVPEALAVSCSARRSEDK